MTLIKIIRTLILDYMIWECISKAQLESSLGSRKPELTPLS